MRTFLVAVVATLMGIAVWSVGSVAWYYYAARDLYIEPAVGTATLLLYVLPFVAGAALACRGALKRGLPTRTAGAASFAGAAVTGVALWLYPAFTATDPVSLRGLWEPLAGAALGVALTARLASHKRTRARALD